MTGVSAGDAREAVTLHFDDVALRYPRGAAPALAGVTFAVPPGRVTAVAGPNGSGKSSLVRALLARVPLAGGRVLVGSGAAAPRDARELPPAERARLVAVVPQREEPAFPLCVRDYVALGRLPYGSRWGAPRPATRPRSPRRSPTPASSRSPSA